MWLKMRIIDNFQCQIMLWPPHPPSINLHQLIYLRTQGHGAEQEASVRANSCNTQTRVWWLAGQESRREKIQRERLRPSRAKSPQWKVYPLKTTHPTRRKNSATLATILAFGRTQGVRDKTAISGAKSHQEAIVPLLLGDSQSACGVQNCGCFSYAIKDEDTSGLLQLLQPFPGISCSTKL